MIIPFALVPDTTASKLQRTLPAGYSFEEFPFVDGEPEAFTVFAGSTQVAIVLAGDSGFEFQYEKNRQGTWLKDEMEKLYFAEDLRWLLVFSSYEDKWGYMGAPAKTKELAMDNIGPLVMKRGAMLVGFSLGEWKEMRNSLNYLHSFQLHGTAEHPLVDETDMGPAMIEFTTLESG